MSCCLAVVKDIFGKKEKLCIKVRCISMTWVIEINSGFLWATNEKLWINFRVFSFHLKSKCMRGFNVNRWDRSFRDACGEG